MKNIYIPDKPIAFNRDFVGLGVGITGALFLSQSMYWHKRSTKKDNWFYKTQIEWEDETGLSRREQESARRKLKELGILEESLAGVPARMYYRINIEVLSDLLCVQTSMAESAILESTNAPYSDGGKRHTITENTQRVLYREEKEKNIKEKDEEVKLILGVLRELPYLGKTLSLKFSEQDIIRLLEEHSVNNIIEILKRMDRYYVNQKSTNLVDLPKAVRFWFSKTRDLKKDKKEIPQDVALVSGDVAEYLQPPPKVDRNTKPMKDLRKKWSKKNISLTK